MSSVKSQQNARASTSVLALSYFFFAFYLTIGPSPIFFFLKLGYILKELLFLIFVYWYEGGHPIVTWLTMLTKAPHYSF